MTILEMMICCYLILAYCSKLDVTAYFQSMLVTSYGSKKFFEMECANTKLDDTIRSQDGDDYGDTRGGMLREGMVPFYSSTSSTTPEPDPYRVYKGILHQILFGHTFEYNHAPVYEKDIQLLSKKNNQSLSIVNITDRMLLFPKGSFLRSETFNNKTAVHFCPIAYIHAGHSRLNVTMDHMQTALNAFSILTAGDLNDIHALPPDYVLRSARTIAMMKLPMEKLAELWTVVKKGRKTSQIPYHELEMYRPLFKYLNAREMARLNLANDQILAYVGRHEGLDRHQVGVVASKYMQINKNWREPKYLNLMSNLLCGVPLNFMRKVPSEVYLQLTHQALGKSYSWSARDVSRLGLLLTELQGYNLSLIKPEAMSGITAQVMQEMSASNLQHLSEMQIRYLGLKPLNILARKLKTQQKQLRVNNSNSIILADGFPLLLALIYVLNKT